MKLVVFGATGGVGKEVVTLAAQAGHEVIAVTRQQTLRDNIPTGVTYVSGSVTEVNDVARLCQGADAVISAVGTSHYKQPVNLYSDGVAALIQGLKMTDVSRLIVLSAGGATVEPNDAWPFRYIFKPILQKFFHNLYDDMLRMERVLENSDLNWTILRLSYLTNKPATGKYRTHTDGAVPYGFSISRADVAHYIVHHVTDEASYHHHVGIAY